MARAVQCDADQVIILTGIEQAAYLAARLLLEPGDTAWVEEPGFPGAARAFATAGAKVVPVPVDANGLNYETLEVNLRQKVECKPFVLNPDEDHCGREKLVHISLVE